MDESLENKLRQRIAELKTEAEMLLQERDKAEAQLAAAQERVRVLEGALREIVEQFERVKPRYSGDNRAIEGARAALAGDE